MPFCQYNSAYTCKTDFACFDFSRTTFFWQLHASYMRHQQTASTAPACRNVLLIRILSPDYLGNYVFCCCIALNERYSIEWGSDWSGLSLLNWAPMLRLQYEPRLSPPLIESEPILLNVGPMLLSFNVMNEWIIIIIIIIIIKRNRCLLST